MPGGSAEMAHLYGRRGSLEGAPGPLTPVSSGQSSSFVDSIMRFLHIDEPSSPSTPTPAATPQDLSKKGTTTTTTSSTVNSSKKKKKSGPSDEDDRRAERLNLEDIEYDERCDLEGDYDAFIADLERVFHIEKTDVLNKSVWSGEKGQSITDLHLRNFYILFFRQMKNMLRQKLPTIFFRGVAESTLGMSDVASCVAALQLVEMAIMDDDIHSFAFPLLAAKRVSLDNCPPDRRYLYFSFMAFKSLSAMFRGNVEGFRHAVSECFYDRRTMSRSIYSLPLHALMNAIAPIVVSQHFQLRCNDFYHTALQLEKEMCSSPSTSTDDSHFADGNWTTISVKFQRGEKIGEGGFGKVYQCVDVSCGALYALKEIPLEGKKRRKRKSVTGGGPGGVGSGNQVQSDVTTPAATNNSASGSGRDSAFTSESERQRHQQLMAREAAIRGEINLLKALHNEHIISYYGCCFDRSNGFVSVLMEYCPKSLRGMVDGTGPLSPHLIAHYTEKILQGLAYLHENHIVHRDIKAANILLKEDGTVKVSDFGTAMLSEIEENNNNNSSSSSTGNGGGKTSSSSSQTGGKSVVPLQGTALFLAPEVVNESLPTEASDIWSLGCLVIELATGQYPWSEVTDEMDEPPNDHAIAYFISQATSPPILNPTYCPAATLDNDELRDFLSLCLSMDPCRRPTARQLLHHRFLLERHHGCKQENDDSLDMTGGEVHVYTGGELVTEISVVDGANSMRPDVSSFAASF